MSKAESHIELTDEQFATAFADFSLTPELFNHKAHLRLAWVHLKASGLKAAIESVCTQIAAFASHHGAAGKYHHTLTVAAVRIVHHFEQKGGSLSFSGFIDAHPQLITDFKNLLNAHYSPEILTSETARSQYISPDLLPFD